MPKKGLAEFHSRHFYSATIAAKAFRALLREVKKYPSIVGFEPGTLALIANFFFLQRANQFRRKEGPRLSLH